MTIYNYVDGREGLEQLVTEAVMAEASWAIEPFIAEFAQTELAGPLSRSRDEDLTAITDRVAALPPERFPKLIEIAHAAVTSDPETEFRAGPRIILKGLKTKASRAVRNPRSHRPSGT